MRKNYFNKPITKRFIDAFPKFKNNLDDGKIYFWEAWQASPFYDANITEEQMKTVYDNLLAEYYSWHYKYMDDLGIALNTFKVISQYYPNVLERLSLAKQLRELTLEEYSKSNISINSSGQNPKIKKQMDELIDLVDSQNANFQKKSPEQTIRTKFISLFDGIMDDFLLRFRPLFVKLYTGVNDYVYTDKYDSEIFDENIEEEE
ncbi:MAG: hypothetical protein RR839_00525 [Oscillospiraceae bacterium]